MKQYMYLSIPLLIAFAALIPTVASGDISAHSQASSTSDLHFLSKEAGQVCGDVNGINGFNIVDIVMIIKFALGIIEPDDTQKYLSDLNNDGEITVDDSFVGVQSIVRQTDITKCGSPAYGLAYGPFREGQSPGDIHPQPSLEELRDDLSQLRSITSEIRTYSAAGDQFSIAEIAADYGFSVAQGVFLGCEDSLNDQEVNNAINLANQNLVEYVIVGNETLFNQSDCVDEQDLKEYIEQVRTGIKNDVQITTGEPWDVWANSAYSDVAEELDFILVHIYPFWHDVLIENAAHLTLERFNEVQAMFPDKEVILGETGWPSGGTFEQACVPSDVVPSGPNQSRYFREFDLLADQNSIKYYFFSAFDEEWKWGETKCPQPLELPLNKDLCGNFVGSSWGIFRCDGQLKPDFSGVFPNAFASPSRGTRIIYDSRGLSAFYNFVVTSSEGKSDWLVLEEDQAKMAYPAEQQWGAVLVQVGEAASIPNRSWKDFSDYSKLAVEMKGENGGEAVEIGIKDRSDPDDGSETKVEVTLSSEWQEFCFDLSGFETAKLDELNAVVEFVFTGTDSKTVFFREVKYVPAQGSTNLSGINSSCD